MIPEQELFDTVFSRAKGLGYTVYDHLPLESENATYPFVNIGDVNSTISPYKDAYGARIDITLNVWDTGENRYNVAKMMNALSAIGRGVLLSENFRFVGRPSLDSNQIITDTSVPDTVLMHGVLTLTYDLC